MENKDTNVHGTLVEIAQQFNYSRTYVGLDKVKVHVPGGFHLESFDQRERRLCLKSLFLLCDSVITYANCPDEDGRSFLDINSIRGNILPFTSYSRCEIDQTLYDTSSPKWPLDAILSLEHVGSTSYTVLFDLLSPSQVKPYAKIWFTTVFVDADTRRPCPLPSWWRDIYSPLATSATPLRMETLVRPASSSCLPLVIYYSDTDDNQHTNWATYIRACYDAFMAGVFRKTYSTITDKEVSKGVKTFEIRFLKESLMGDTLEVYSWEMRTPSKGLGFEIKKGSDVCCQAVMTFHDHMIQDGANSKL